LLCALRVEPSTTYSFFSGKSRDEASSSISCLHAPCASAGCTAFHHRLIMEGTCDRTYSRKRHHESKHAVLSLCGGR